jgi:hypothetical protein
MSERFHVTAADYEAGTDSRRVTPGVAGFVAARLGALEAFDRQL